MRLAIALAGHLTISVGGEPVDVHRLGRNGRLAFAFLVLERPRVVPRYELAEVIWGESLPATWETGLRGVVSAIRAVLSACGLAAAAALRTAHGCYQLTLPPTEVDVEAAVAGLKQAERLLASDPAAAGAHAEAALAVAVRPFLSGATGMWVEQQQARLDDLRLDALETLADVAGASGDWAAALSVAERAVGLANLRESAHRRVMTAHDRLGNRGEALRAYERCRRTLVEELGVSPARETDDLYQGLLSEEAVPAPPRPINAQLPEPLCERPTRFVGRVVELAELRAAWADACQGRIQVAVIAGEAGIGKTRLSGRLAAEAQPDGALVLYGRCDENGLLPYQALTEALTRLVTTTESGLLAEYLSGAGALARLVPALTGRLPTLEVPRATEPGTDRRLLFEAVRLALERLASAGPVLLVVDDVQWADQATLGLVRHVLRTAEREAVLIVLNYRVGELHAQHSLPALLAGLRRERPVTSLTLSGLAQDEVGNLIDAWAGHSAPQQLTTTVHDDTGGNPFFIEELLRFLAQRGRFGLAEGVTAVGDTSVPPTVREVIASRTAALDAAARRVLDAVAVAGRNAEVALLMELPDLRGVDVIAGIELAVGARLLAEAPGGVFFPHALVREAIYRDLSGARREHLHAQLADALARRAHTPAAWLAHHLLAAGPAARPGAVDAALAAASEATAVFAYEEAVRHCALALDALDPRESRRRAEVLLEIGAGHWRAGTSPSARAAFKRAADEARLAGDPVLQARAAFGVAAGGPTAGTTNPDVIAVLESALAAPLADLGLRARLEARLGSELAGSDLEAARVRGARAVELARTTTDAATKAYTLHCQRFALLGEEDPAAALGLDDRIIALGAESADRHMVLEGHIQRFSHLLASGQAAAARTEVDEIDDLARELRQPFYQRYPLRFRACMLLAAGQFDEALQFAGDAYAIERRVHDSDAILHSGLLMSIAHWERGGYDELEQHLEELSEYLPPAPTWRAAAAVAVAPTRPQLARQRLRDLLSEGPIEGLLAPATLGLAAEAAIAINDHAAGATLFAMLLPRGATDLVGGSGVVWLGAAVGYLGRLARMLGDSRADTFLAEALVRNERNGAAGAAARVRTAHRG